MTDKIRERAETLWVDIWAHGAPDKLTFVNAISAALSDAYNQGYIQGADAERTYLEVVVDTTEDAYIDDE